MMLFKMDNIKAQATKSNFISRDTKTHFISIELQLRVDNFWMINVFLKIKLSNNRELC